MSPFHRNGSRAAWQHVSRFTWYRSRAAGIPAVLNDLALLESAVQETRAAIVRDMRAEGCTWNEIGEALGVSAQAAHHRYRTVTE